MQANDYIPGENVPRDKEVLTAFSEKYGGIFRSHSGKQNGAMSTKANGEDETIDISHQKGIPKLRTKSTAERFRQVGLKARFVKRLEKIADDRMTVKQIFNRYVENSTLHGFRFIFMQTFFIRRLLWTILTVTMAAIFLSELKNSIELYCQYPFTTTSTMEYIPKLKFPAISICNLNSLHEPRVKSDHLSDFYRRALIPMKYHNDIWSDIPGLKLQQILKESSKSIDDIFQGCEWKSQDTAKTGIPNLCYAQNFTSYVDLHGQTCYTFNGKGAGTPLILNETGLDMALKLEFDLQANKSLLPLQEVGLKIIVHNQDETPLQQAGFVISPGFHTLVELKVRKTENLPGPYATRCGETTLEFFHTYRQSKCFLEKLTKEIISKCNCKSLYMKELNIGEDMIPCSLNQTVNCLLPIVDAFDRKTNIECPVDCQSTTYGTSLSYARFVADSSIRSANPGSRKSSYINRLQYRMNSEDLEKYIEENVIVVQFFYQEMKEENVQQEPSYDHFKLIGDVGGQLGLLLGASVLTLVEFVDLFFFTVYHQLLRLYRRKLRENDVS